MVCRVGALLFTQVLHSRVTKLGIQALWGVSAGLVDQLCWCGVVSVDDVQVLLALPVSQAAVGVLDSCSLLSLYMQACCTKPSACCCRCY